MMKLLYCAIIIDEHIIPDFISFLLTYILIMTEKETSSDQPVPSLNVTMPAVPEEQKNIISDDMLLGAYDEIVRTIRQDRVEVSDILNNFCEMVMNEGDSSSASKEAIVQLIKIKSDTADKMARVAELMTRVKLRDPFPRYLNAKQENNFNTLGDADRSALKKELLHQLNRTQKKMKKEEKDG